MCFLFYSTLSNSTLLYSAVHCSSVLHSPVLCSGKLKSIQIYPTQLNSALLYCTLPSSTLLCFYSTQLYEDLGQSGDKPGLAEKCVDWLQLLVETRLDSMLHYATRLLSSRF